MLRAAFIALCTFTALAVAGCGYGGDEDPLADEDIVDKESALTRGAQAGSELETSARLNLRAGPSKQHTVLLTMPLGAVVTLTSATPSNGFVRVTYGNRSGWAYGAYLVEAEGGFPGGDDTDPGPPPPAGSGKAVRITGPAVRAHVQSFANASCATNGCPHAIGTRNGHSPTADRAIDMMESTGGTRPKDGGAHGTRVASFALARGDSSKVMYVIWQQRINSLDGRGWRGMADRGGITANHFDHVHVSFDP